MAVEPGLSEKNPPRNFGSLARRISTYTTRGILCAGVVVAGVAFGRQVMLWWGVESLPLGETGGETAIDALGDPGRPHTGRQAASRSAAAGHMPRSVFIALRVVGQNVAFLRAFAGGGKNARLAGQAKTSRRGGRLVAIV